MPTRPHRGPGGGDGDEQEISGGLGALPSPTPPPPPPPAQPPPAPRPAVAPVPARRVPCGPAASPVPRPRTGPPRARRAAPAVPAPDGPGTARPRPAPHGTAGRAPYAHFRSLRTRRAAPGRRVPATTCERLPRALLCRRRKLPATPVENHPGCPVENSREGGRRHLKHSEHQKESSRKRALKKPRAPMAEGVREVPPEPPAHSDPSGHTRRAAPSRLKPPEPPRTPAANPIPTLRPPASTRRAPGSGRGKGHPG